jgi:hypothetical protein
LSVDIFPSLPSTAFTSRDDASTENHVEPIEEVDVYPTPSFCERSQSPEFYSTDESDSTPTHSPSDYEVNDPWSSSASSGDLPVNFPPLSRSDGGRSRPATFHVDGTTCRIDDWMYRVCRRRAAVRSRSSGAGHYAGALSLRRRI